MSLWLKWRLIALFGIVALMVGGGVLRAQNPHPAPAKTEQKAATMFFDFLQRWNGEMGNPGEMRSKSGESLGVQAGALSPPGLLNESLADDFFARLVTQAGTTKFSGKITRSEDGIFVEAEPTTGAKPRQVVIKAEDDGFRVDLFATYGLWNDLSGKALDKKVYELTGIIGPSLASDREFLVNQRRSQCQYYLKQQMLGILTYSQDYDEKMPPARRWKDVLWPYLRSEEIFTCPSRPKGKQGYAFNQNLSQIGLDKIKSSAKTVAIYETSSSQTNVFGPGTGRAFRHKQGWNLAFADGHIKWYRRDFPIDVGNFKP